LQRLLNSHPQIRCHFQKPIYPLLDQIFYRPIAALDLNKSPFRGLFDSEQKEREYRVQLKYLKAINLLQSQFYKDLILSFEQKEEYRVAKDLHIQLSRELILGILKDNNKTIFGSKTHADLNIFLEVFSEGKVVEIVRDGRDVCVSKRFHQIKRGIYFNGEEKSRILYHLNKYNITRSMVRRMRSRFGWFKEGSFRERLGQHFFCEEALHNIVTDWRFHVEYMQGIKGSYPGNVLTIRYEDLLENPGTKLVEVLKFLEAECNPEIVEKVLSENSFSQEKSGPGSFFRKGQKGDWVNHFEPEDKAIFKKYGGETLVNLDYESSLDW